MRHCFGRSKFLSANLSAQEDIYPQGPSNQFYRLFSSTSLAGSQYDFLFLMEHDVRVVRAGWLDALWLEVATPAADLEHYGGAASPSGWPAPGRGGDSAFYVKGSILRGRRVDSNLKYAECSEEWKDARQWLRHINGNAFYAVGSQAFRSLVNATRQLYDPNSGWKPFDTSIHRAMVSNFMTNWPSYQTMAHKFVYTQLIQNWSEEVSDEVVADIRAQQPNTFLVHGNSADSQGDAKNNPLLLLPVRERDLILAKAREEVGNRASDNQGAGGEMVGGVSDESDMNMNMWQMEEEGEPAAARDEEQSSRRLLS